jgi:hypothetical protein
MIRTFRRCSVPFLAMLTLAACGGSDQTGASAAAAGAAPAGASATSAGDGAADALELRDYELSMDDVRQWGAAARAVARLARENPQWEDQLSMEASDASIDAFAAQLEQLPAVREAIEDAGLSPREYAVTTFVVVQSMLAQAAIQQGANADSFAMKAGINPDNVTFMKEHEAEIRAVFADLQGK